MKEQYDIETVEAMFCVEVYVQCPNKECGRGIDMLMEKDTNRAMFKSDKNLVMQTLANGGGNSEFERKGIICSGCKTKINVKGLSLF